MTFHSLLTCNNELAQTAAGGSTEHVLEKGVCLCWSRLHTNWSRSRADAGGGQNSTAVTRCKRGKQVRGRRQGTREELCLWVSIALRTLEEVLHTFTPHKCERAFQTQQLHIRKRERKINR